MGEAPPRRYLWTDAFAVMTWLGLGERELARRLVDQVHEVLAPRPVDLAHPTARGLRIGKPLPERGADEPLDPRLEWERDGQYYHYLTRWMHALARAASVLQEERYRQWAAELMQTAHAAFSHARGLYWKMSIDLSRPLVPSMGAHDPLEGLIEAASLGLERETRELAAMCARRPWVTDDPLGAGGLLVAALRLERLVAGGRGELAALLERVLDDAVTSVEAAAALVGGPAGERLAFRELGLALGLRAVPLIEGNVAERELKYFLPVADELERFWLDPGNHEAATWREHRDINAVTLAACLAPEGVLG